MAVYRQVHVSYWQDGFVLDLTPEEKYFYIYLMTNSKTTQCGIYELPKKNIEFETGYNRETVDKLLDRFVKYGKIMYNERTREIMLTNWIKHNSMKSPKVRACVEKELSEVKTPEFVSRFISLSIQYGYPIESLSIDSGEEKEKEQEQEEEKEQQGAKNSLGLVVRTFEEIFGRLPNGIQVEDLGSYVDAGMSPELIGQAMRKTRQMDKPVGYMFGILKNCSERNILTLEQAQDDERTRKADGDGKAPHLNSLGSKGSTANGQRDERYSAFYELFPDA